MEEKEIRQIITDKPDYIEFGKRIYYFYPLTLGKTLLIADYCQELHIDEDFYQDNMQLALLYLAKNSREKCLQFVRLFTIPNIEDAKNKVYDVVGLRAFQKQWNKVPVEDLAAIMLTLLSRKDMSDEISRHFALDKEVRRMKQAEEAKGDDSTFMFCGKSLYGTMIYNACEKFGWTYDYIVWGVSLTNLKMLFADSIKTIYLSKDERKKAHISNDRTMVNMDNAQAAREFFRTHNFN